MFTMGYVCFRRSWLGEITNFNNVDSNGFSGLPNNQHDMLYIKNDKCGTIRYRVHTVKSGWLDWVAKVIQMIWSMDVRECW